MAIRYGNTVLLTSVVLVLSDAVGLYHRYSGYILYGSGCRHAQVLRKFTAASFAGCNVGHDTRERAAAIGFDGY